MILILGIFSFSFSSSSNIHIEEDNSVKDFIPTKVLNKKSQKIKKKQTQKISNKHGDKKEFYIIHSTKDKNNIYELLFKSSNKIYTNELISFVLIEGIIYDNDLLSDFSTFSNNVSDNYLSDFRVEIKKNDTNKIVVCDMSSLTKINIDSLLILSIDIMEDFTSCSISYEEKIKELVYDLDIKEIEINIK